jgi:hypothetical protein
MNATADHEAPDAFYRAEERGETVPWMRNGRWRVKFCNASVLGRRDEGVAPISEGERSNVERLLIPARRGDRRMQRRGGMQPAAGVKQRMD